MYNGKSEDLGLFNLKGRDQRNDLIISQCKKKKKKKSPKQNKQKPTNNHFLSPNETNNKGFLHRVAHAILSVLNIVFLYSPPTQILGILGGSAVKNPPAMQEAQVRSLGLEYSLEKKMATHCSILAWETLWTEEPGGLQSMGPHKSQT